MDPSKLKLGLYKFYWKNGGGESLCAVGQTYNGTRWYAACNWTSSDNENPRVVSTDWRGVEMVELIRSSLHYHDGDI